MELEPITRKEKIIAGQDLTPITRMEKFLKDFGGGGGGGSGGGWFVVTASVDESENIIVDHYRDDIAAAFENGKMPIVKMTYDGETNIMNMVSITQDVANFIYVILSGNQNAANVKLRQINIGKEDTSFSMRNIIGK